MGVVIQRVRYIFYRDRYCRVQNGDDMKFYYCAYYS